MADFLQTLRRGIVGKALTPPTSRGGGGWIPLIRESWAGAWQHNRTLAVGSADAHHAVYACKTLIAGDIAKLRPRLVRDIGGDVWATAQHTYASPLLRKPNHFQTWGQFIESWILSKLGQGNAYIVKRRNGRGDVIALYVLDACRTKPMIAPDGSLFYELDTDNISGLTERVLVPAREIIHDRAATLFHPLVGIPPIYASGLAATHALAIQTSQEALFRNASQPGGVLIAPGRVDPENAKELKEYWQANFTGANAGNVAILGDGMKFEKMSLTAEEAQLIDQLKMSAQIICSTFHVPPFMVGMGEVPALGSIEAINLLYYSQCLQAHIEAIEACLDAGLDLPADMGVEIEVEGLLRMDTATRVKALTDAVGGSIMTPNEARARIDLPPVAGGDSCYAQQQDFSLAALAERDSNKPFANPQRPPQA
jgi:HK97 family phage portal protein